MEELDDTVFEQEFGTQTDAVKDDTPVESYPHPYQVRGESKHTWIESGDLFDFDEAVQPILQTLIGKSLEYGLAEVLEEQELKVLRKYREVRESVWPAFFWPCACPGELRWNSGFVCCLF